SRTRAPVRRRHAGGQARPGSRGRDHRPQLPDRSGRGRGRLWCRQGRPFRRDGDARTGRGCQQGSRSGGSGRVTLARRPPLDAWLAKLGLEVVGRMGEAGDAAMSRDIVLDGERRFDLRVTVAWVDGVGLSLWAYYGLEAM